jgi:hypothetical protein
MHRAMLADFGPALAGFEAERDALEARFRDRVDAALAARADVTALRALSDLCWSEALAAERRWAAGLPAPRPDPDALPHRRSWARLNQVAGLPKVRP